MAQLVGSLADRSRTAPRTVRRLVVLETFLAYPAVILAWRLLVANGVVSVEAWAVLVLALIVVLEVLGLLVIATFVGHRADARHPSLDERQRALAIRAQAVSYTVLGAAVVGVTAGVALWVSFVGPVRLDGALLLPLAVMLGVYLPVLPAAVLAWIEPDAPAEDEAAPTPVERAAR